MWILCEQSFSEYFVSTNCLYTALLRKTICPSDHFLLILLAFKIGKYVATGIRQQCSQNFIRLSRLFGDRKWYANYINEKFDGNELKFGLCYVKVTWTISNYSDEPWFLYVAQFIISVASSDALYRMQNLSGRHEIYNPALIFSFYKDASLHWEKWHPHT